MELKCIAKIYTDFDEKFGIPRQSGKVPQLRGRIVFEPAYRHPDAVRELTEYDWLWLIWGFSEVPVGRVFTPTVRPPRLGGNKRVGVFATRSPFRPNPIGLSSVRIESVAPEGPEGPEIIVSGVDMLNGTPIYDIKPYLPYTDAHPGARGGFARDQLSHRLQVSCDERLLVGLSKTQKEALLAVLAEDPRPGYQQDPERVYGLAFAGRNVSFTVDKDILTVLAVSEYHK